MTTKRRPNHQTKLYFLHYLITYKNKKTIEEEKNKTKITCMYGEYLLSLKTHKRLIDLNKLII